MDQVAVVVSFSSRVFKRLPRIPLSLPGIGCPFQDPGSRFQESVAALMRLHTTPDFGANGVGILAWKGIRGLRQEAAHVLGCLLSGEATIVGPSLRKQCRNIAVLDL